MITEQFEKEATPYEIDKFKLHVSEIDKINQLLLALSGRLARAENALNTLSSNAETTEKVSVKLKT